MNLLKGITWNHTRGFTSVVAAAQRFEELNPDIRIVWEKRSLQAFADEPIDKLAQRYDFLVIDHPWAGFAARNEVIIPLDKYLPKDFVDDQRKNSVGHSYESYSYNNHLWALPIDAATPVASARDDILKSKHIELPDTWEDLIDLAKKGLVVFPGIPQDTLMNFYMICSTLGEDPCQTKEYVVSHNMGLDALHKLRELALLIPHDCFDWNPIKTYENMTRTDSFAYCPFAYGYVNYSRRFYTPNNLTFYDMVQLGSMRCRSTLGGTGLAISAQSEFITEAIQYAEFIANEDAQKGFFYEYGGQPGHKKAWQDDYVNKTSRNFFKNTLPSLERAFLRPRYHGHMFFQDNAGAPIREYMMNGGNAEQLLVKLNDLYQKSLHLGGDKK